MTGTQHEPCGRLGVGLGTDTWDPVCDLPVGHEGSCSWHPWLHATTTDAFMAELNRLDRREQRLTGQTLATAPLDYRARVDEIKLRLESALTSDPPMLPELNVAGAHLVALVDRVVEALTARPETGDDS